MHLLLRAVSQPRLAMDRLAEIAGLEQFRPGFRDRLIGLFGTAMREHLPHCLDAGDPTTEQRRHAAHSLKGAAHSIGASRLAALAYEVEQAASLEAPNWPDPEPIRSEAAIALQLLELWATGADISASIAD